MLLLGNEFTLSHWFCVEVTTWTRKVGNFRIINESGSDYTRLDIILLEFSRRFSTRLFSTCWRYGRITDAQNTVFLSILFLSTNTNGDLLLYESKLSGKSCPKFETELHFPIFIKPSKNSSFCPSQVCKSNGTSALKTIARCSYHTDA